MKHEDGSGGSRQAAKEQAVDGPIASPAHDGRFRRYRTRLEQFVQMGDRLSGRNHEIRIGSERRVDGNDARLAEWKFGQFGCRPYQGFRTRQQMLSLTASGIRKKLRDSSFLVDHEYIDVPRLQSQSLSDSFDGIWLGAEDQAIAAFDQISALDNTVVCQPFESQPIGKAILSGSSRDSEPVVHLREPREAIANTAGFAGPLYQWSPAPHRPFGKRYDLSCGTDRCGTG